MAQIIPKNLVSVESNWQKELATAFTDPESLLHYLKLDPRQFSEDVAARKLFPMRVPRHFASLMHQQDRHDPLLLQVFPRAAEFDKVAGFTHDPLSEQHNTTPGLLHKYRSRVLLIVRGGCAVNCRYCFRRHFPYADNSPSRAQWDDALTKIAADETINEVILSGGDPLMAKDLALADLASKIADIASVKRLRIHTRLPVVLPHRVDTGLLSWLEALPLQRVMVLHINHVHEISPALVNAVSALKKIGVTVLNQAVLLRGINDSVDTQVALSEGLFDAGILPYYLHLLDKVAGAAHFEVSTGEAKRIVREMLLQLPGFLVPKLVREVAGEGSKSPIDLHCTAD
ncbi:EF-P beta-lysylation protein EpmB [Alteromonas oceanisediminis]|uniref:EF-P beta-lysylation protein EpmB n=1 Tax=Alteromonas oceanisediminis TaxID=2836180 RepID=UPI001BD99D3C|nr:EF-P beta-lysylation protein EpmB [Alteromonas oceanisediminis]MBT0585346.1 EF-P beta-lysylation protein EpmB [Alteromonas oceanisediminis]